MLHPKSKSELITRTESGTVNEKFQKLIEQKRDSGKCSKKRRSWRSYRNSKWICQWKRIRIWMMISELTVAKDNSSQVKMFCRIILWWFASQFIMHEQNLLSECDWIKYCCPSKKETWAKNFKISFFFFSFSLHMRVTECSVVPARRVRESGFITHVLSLHSKVSMNVQLPCD